MAEDLVQIRDPVHGTLQLTRAELAVVDHPAFQRLRLIKQLGFADLAYPGATHSRYAHALGTLHVASRMLESVLRKSNLPSLEVQRYRQLLRLAALFHDLGHAPLSHTTERFMPLVRELNLGPWCLGDPDRQATHEDYTLLIITRSSLTSLLQQRFAALDVGPEDIAAVIAGWAPRAVAERFVVSGQNWLPLLHQCVSSELDADRMDYLLRDSYFAGVPYGRYDHEWLLDNLTLVEHAGALHLGLIARATFSFEDYLLSRRHPAGAVRDVVAGLTVDVRDAEGVVEDLQARTAGDLFGRRLDGLEVLGKEVRVEVGRRDVVTQRRETGVQG